MTKASATRIAKIGRRARKRGTESPMSDADRKFYAGFVSTMTDDDHRRNRDSSIRQAINDLTGALGALQQHASIREKDNEDEAVADAIRRAVGQLELVVKSAPTRMKL